MSIEQALIGGGGSEEDRARLQELREQEPVDVTYDGDEVDSSKWPTIFEILGFWQTFQGHSGYTGVTPTIKDFGCWLAGSEYRTTLVNAETEKTGPAEVTW